MSIFDYVSGLIENITGGGAADIAQNVSDTVQNGAGDTITNITESAQGLTENMPADPAEAIQQVKDKLTGQ